MFQNWFNPEAIEDLRKNPTDPDEHQDTLCLTSQGFSRDGNIILFSYNFSMLCVGSMPRVLSLSTRAPSSSTTTSLLQLEASGYNIQSVSRRSFALRFEAIRCSRVLFSTSSWNGGLFQRGTRPSERMSTRAMKELLQLSNTVVVSGSAVSTICMYISQTKCVVPDPHPNASFCGTIHYGPSAVLHIIQNVGKCRLYD